MGQADQPPMEQRRRRPRHPRQLDTLRLHHLRGGERRHLDRARLRLRRADHERDQPLTDRLRESRRQRSAQVRLPGPLQGQALRHPDLRQRVDLARAVLRREIHHRRRSLSLQADPAAGRQRRAGRSPHPARRPRGPSAAALQLPGARGVVEPRAHLHVDHRRPGAVAGRGLRLERTLSAAGGHLPPRSGASRGPRRLQLPPDLLGLRTQSQPDPDPGPAAGPHPVRGRLRPGRVAIRAHAQGDGRDPLFL